MDFNNLANTMEIKYLELLSSLLKSGEIDVDKAREISQEFFLLLPFENFDDIKNKIEEINIRNNKFSGLIKLFLYFSFAGLLNCFSCFPTSPGSKTLLLFSNIMPFIEVLLYFRSRWDNQGSPALKYSSGRKHKQHTQNGKEQNCYVGNGVAGKFENALFL